MASERIEELEQSHLPELCKFISNACKTPFLKGCSPCPPCATVATVPPWSLCGCWQGNGSRRFSRSRSIPELAVPAASAVPGR